MIPLTPCFAALTLTLNDGVDEGGTWTHIDPAYDWAYDDFNQGWASNGADVRGFHIGVDASAYYLYYWYCYNRSDSTYSANVGIYSGSWYYSTESQNTTQWVLQENVFQTATSAILRISGSGDGSALGTAADCFRMILINPGAPASPNVSAYTEGTTAATWSWTAGTYDARYDVAVVNRTPGGTWSAWTYHNAYVDHNVVSGTLSSLVVGQEYKIAVRTRNWHDSSNTYANLSGWAYEDEVSNVLITGTPGTPTVGDTTLTSSSLNVNIAPGSNAAVMIYAIKVTVGASTYYVQSNGTLGASAVWQTDATWGDKVVTGLSANTMYTFQAIGDAPSGKFNYGGAYVYSAEVSKYTLCLAAPTSLTWGTITTTSIYMSWNANGNAAGTTYRLEYSNDGASWLLAGETTNTYLTHSSLTPGKKYYYKVCAKNGDGTYTSYATPTPAYKYTLPNPPGTITWGTITVSSIYFSWTTNSNDSAVVYYTSHSITGTSWSAETNSANAYYDDTGLSPNTIHYYRVWTRNGDNKDSSYTAPSPTYKYTLCNTPSAPTVTAVSSTSINVVINENSNPTNTTFSIKVVHSGGTEYVQSAKTLGASAVYQTKSVWGTINVSGLTANRQYTVSVDAKNGDGTATSYSSTAAKYTYPQPANVTETNSRQTGVPYPDAIFVFTNAIGFGSNNDTGTKGTYYYRYKVSQNTSYTFTGSEEMWSASTLGISTSTAGEGTYYLHLKPYNSDNASSTQGYFGPYNYGYYYGGVPKMEDTSGNYEIFCDVFAQAGYMQFDQDLTNDATVYYALGEPGGISVLNEGGGSPVKYVYAGFYCGDFTEPGPVADLVASRADQLKLTWSSPGEDDETGTLTNGVFRIKVSTDPAYSWSFADYTVAITTTATPDEAQAYYIGNLCPDATKYYAHIWTVDAHGNVSINSNEANSYAGYFTRGQDMDKQFAFSALAVADFNNDGYQDFAVSGSSQSAAPERYTYVYKNNAGASFGFFAELSALNAGQMKWLDYDNDGDQDLMNIGYTGSVLVAELMKYDSGDEMFNADGAAVTEITATAYGSIDVGDYNNDGWQDLVVTGTGTSNANLYATTKLYKNTAGMFTYDSSYSVNISSVGDNSCARFLDYDNDGDLDLIVAGNDTSFTPYTGVYRNEGSSFTEVQELTGVKWCDIASGDYDNDGYMDILVMGYTGSEASIKLYRNQNNAAAPFTDSGVSFTAGYHGHTAFGDIDRDGDLDIVYTGYVGTTMMLKIYENTGSGFTIFADDLSYSAVRYGTVGFIEADNDGDLDFIVAGRSYESPALTNITRVYENTLADTGLGSSPNTIPTAPAAASFVLIYSTVTHAITFTFPNGSDTETTDADGLYYNISAGSDTAETVNQFVPSYYANNLMGNYLRPRRPGSDNQVLLLKDVQADTSYYYRVQTIDSGLKASAWSSSVMVVSSQCPAAVTTLGVTQAWASGYVSLSWVAPGDNGWNDTLTDGRYLIKYSNTGEITNWDSPPSPTYTLYIATTTEPYANQMCYITCLVPGATYYFRMKTSDKRGYWSDMSNSTSTYAQPEGLVMVNEIFPSGGANVNWVELYSRFGNTIDLSGWKVKYTSGTLDTMANNIYYDIWAIENGTALSYNTVVTTSSWYDMQVTSGMVRIIDQFNNFVSTLQYPSLYTDDANKPISFARISDGNTYFERDPTPTCNLVNSVSNNIKINEVRYGLLNDEFVEFKSNNASASEVLTNYSLRNKRGVASTDPYWRPLRFTAGIDTSGFNSRNYSSFSSSDTNELTEESTDYYTWDFCMSNNAGAGLDAAGDFVVLENASGQAVDRVQWWHTDVGYDTGYMNYTGANVNTYPTYTSGNLAAPRSIGRVTDGTDTDNDANDFTTINPSNEGGKNTDAGFSNTLAMPVNDQYLSRTFTIKFTLGGDSSGGVFDTVRFDALPNDNTTDYYSPHYYRLTDMDINLATLTQQTTSLAGITTNDIDGHPLTSLVTYHMTLKTDNAGGSASDIRATTLYYDADSPAAVNTLSALTGALGRTIELTWTVPGDNFGTIDLIAGSSYYIMYSSFSSPDVYEDPTDSWWDAQKANAQVVVSTGPIAMNTEADYLLNNLVENSTYWIRMWYRDSVGNWSPLSNAASAWAQVVIIAIDIPNTDNMFNFETLSPGEVKQTTSTITVNHLGTVYQTYSINVVTGTAGGANTVWDVSNTPAGNIFAIKGVFSYYDAQPASEYFSEATDDNVLLTPKPASATNIAYDSDDADVKGYHVYPGLSRSLWFKLYTPLGVINEEIQTIQLIIQAEESN